MAQQLPPSDPFNNLQDDDLLALEDLDPTDWDQADWAREDWTGADWGENDLSSAGLNSEAWASTEGEDDLAVGTTSPSLPIILLSAASAIAGGVIALYLAYREFALSIELSAAIATFVASMAMGVTGATFSALTGSRAATSNIAFSCGLILISLLFMGICALVGAAAALFLLLIAR